MEYEIRQLQECKQQYITAHNTMCQKAKDLGWIIYFWHNAIHLVSPSLVELICTQEGFREHYDGLNDFIMEKMPKYFKQYQNTANILFVEFED